MCTVIIAIGPGEVLLAGVRDEFADRPWLPPGRHWPAYPDLIGGIDLQAGGTWLAVNPRAGRVACVLNGRGRAAPADGRRSRGSLPLQGAATGELAGRDLPQTDPFHLVVAGLADAEQASAEPVGAEPVGAEPVGAQRGGAEPSGSESIAAHLWSWDGVDLTERKLGTGLHIVVNSGLAGPGSGAGDDLFSARVAYFEPKFAASTPDPFGGGTTAQAWSPWLSLLAGDSLDPADERALIVRRQLDDRTWGSSSVSLVAVGSPGVRYDFTPDPASPDAWSQVQTS
jgi:hypothetical protein